MFRVVSGPLRNSDPLWTMVLAGKYRLHMTYAIYQNLYDIAILLAKFTGHNFTR